MFIFNMTNPLILFMVLIVTILFIYLSQETKKGMVAAIPLFAFLISVVIHTVQLLTLKEEFSYLHSTLCQNLAIDFAFLLLTFLAYLWADEIEAKAFNKKSIDISLKWLWKKV